MKKALLLIAGLVCLVGCASVGATQEAKKSADFTQKGVYVKPSIPIEEAKAKIENFAKGMKNVSKVEVCEGNKYYIGQLLLEGYEDINVIRKVYVNKTTGDLYPTMAETFDYCYMVKK
ncbi:MAG: hypothetical protein GXO45_05565 [Aquificae bacterium]|nr:hypothetical protein [Aquificota bacterium]